MVKKETYLPLARRQAFWVEVAALQLAEERLDGHGVVAVRPREDDLES